MKRLRIDHVTEYRFPRPTTLLPHRLLLRPREDHAVRITSFELDVTPQPQIRWQRDALDNSVALVSFASGSDRLRIESRVVIEHHEQWPLDFVVEQRAVTHPFAYEAPEAALLISFLQPSWPVDRAAVLDWLFGLGIGNAPTETFVLLDRLNRAIQQNFRYEDRQAPGIQSPAQTLARGVGSCRDFAALFVDACRHLSLASRFVSGYVRTTTAVPVGGATHAWADVYLPGPGWKGFDPTHGQVTGTDHIAVAVAQHPQHVPPVAGSFFGTGDQAPALFVSVRVQDWM